MTPINKKAMLLQVDCAMPQ